MRLFSLFPPSAPLENFSSWHLPCKGRPVSLQGRNHNKAGSSSGAHRGNPAPSRNQHNSCCFRLTFCGVYYSFHSWPSLHYYYSFHVKEEILLMNLCDPCCAHSCPDQHITVDEPLAQSSRSPLVSCAQPRQNQMAAPREGCLWMCCVSTAHFYSILSRFHQLVSKKMHWAKPSSVLILIFLKTLIEHSDNEYKQGLGVHRDKIQVKQIGIAAELLSPEMQESPVFPDAVFKNEERIKKISHDTNKHKTSENQVRTKTYTHP